MIADDLVHANADEDPELRAENFVIPVSSTRGWEAAVFDHFSAVCASIAAKIQIGAGAREGESVGGATFSFDVHPAHPFRERVMALLTNVRGEVDALWNEVAAHNRAHPVPDEQKTKVFFYFGQNVQDAGLGHAGPAARAVNNVTERDP